MNTQTKINSLQYLSSMCSDSSSLHTKIAAILLQQKYSHMFEMMLLIIEYIQLMSQALLLAPNLSKDSYLDSNPFFKVVVYAAKLFDFGSWLYSGTHEILTLIILIFFAILTVLKYLLYLYVFFVASQHIKSWEPLLSIWRILFKTQSRIVCYFAVSLWVRVILTTSQYSVGILGISKNAIIVWAGLMIVLEYVFSYFLQVSYCYILPFKSFLSSRNNYLEVLTLTQKLIIQCLQIIIPSDFKAISWIFTSISMLFNLFREFAYFKALPLYNFSALICQGNLLMLVFSLNMACFIENILHDLAYKNSTSFIIVAWTLLAILTIKIMQGYLKALRLTQIDLQKKDNPIFMIHQIGSILKLMKLNNKSKDLTGNYPFSYLSKASLESILNLNIEEKDISSQEAIRKIISEILDNLCLKYPSNRYIKLYTAYFYTTKFPRFGVAMKMAIDLKKSGSYKISLNASLLSYSMEARIEKEYKSSTNKIDITKYLKSRSQVAQLEQKILNQIELQRNLYHEVLSETPDLARIFGYAQPIHKEKQEIQTKMKLVFNTIPDYYVRPLTICALYHSLLTFSVDDYFYYRKKCTQTSQKYDKYYKSAALCEENMFQDSNVLFVLSGQKHNCGRIHYISKAIEGFYGRDAAFYIGNNGGRLTTPSLQGLYMKFYEHLEIKGTQSLPDVITRDFGYHVDGYLVLLDFYFRLHPFTTQGLYLDCIARAVSIKKEFMLILENGDIEGATFKLSKRLGLLKSQRNGSSSQVNVKDLSSDLSELNDAFNIVNKANKDESQNKQDTEERPSHSIKSIITREEIRGYRSGYRSRMDLQTAQSIFSAYTNEGKTINFSSSKTRDHDKTHYEVNYSYLCTVENRFFGPIYLKQVTLEEIGNHNEESLEESFRDPTEQLLNKIQNEKNETSQSENYNDALEEGDFESFRLEDEKKSGWIDPKALEGPQRILSTNLQSEAPDDNLPSPLITTARLPLIPEQKVSSHHKYLNSTPIMKPHIAKLIEERENLEENIDLEPNKAALVYQEPSIASVTSKRTKHKKLSRAFKQALETRHFKGFLKFITIIFYLLLVAIFATQLILKISLDKAVQNLDTGKDIFDLATKRRYYLTNVEVYTRISWDLATQRLVLTDFGRYSNSFAQSSLYLRQIASLLSKANKDFLSSINSLDNNIQQGLFAKDVKFLSKNSVTYFNNFQAVDQIVETVLRVSNLLQNNPSKAEYDVSFLLRNVLNDIYIKNQQIVNILLNSFVDESNRINTNMIAAIVVISILSGGILLALSVITWHNHNEETLNMSAVSRINAQGIRTILDKITNLKLAIENESSFDEDRQNTEFLEHARKQENLDNNLTKKEHYKTLNTRGIFRRYMFYIGRVWILTLLIGSIAILNCLIGKSSLNSFSRKSTQLSVMGQIKSLTSGLGAAHYELFSSNGTTQIYNLPTQTYMKSALKILDGFKSQLSDTFIKDDFTFDPVIAQILFSDGCSLLSPSSKALCNEQKLLASKDSLVYLITDYVNILTDKVTAFENSNKTSQTLVKLEIQRFENITSDFILIGSMCDAVSNYVSQEFEANVVTASQSRQSIFIVLAFTIIILSVLVWVYVLRRLVDYGQQFKRVLSVFPPHLVLSNFVLKSFLMITSNGALNSIKNDI